MLGDGPLFIGLCSPCAVYSTVACSSRPRRHGTILRQVAGHLTKLGLQSQMLVHVSQCRLSLILLMALGLWLSAHLLESLAVLAQTREILLLGDPCSTFSAEGCWGLRKHEFNVCCVLLEI